MSYYNNSLFTIDYQALTTLLTPPLLRNPAMNSWLTSMTSQSQIDNDLYTQYLTGSTYPIYSPLVPYVQGKRVIFNNNGGAGSDAVFENLTGSTGVGPLDSTTWLQINPSFIGAEERVSYNSQKILLEWALNREYQILPIVSNPTSWSGANHTNQIYIDTKNLITNRFLMGQTGPYSSNLTKTSSLNFIDGGPYMGRTFTGSTQYEFVVWVPNLTLYTGITNTNVYQYTSNYVIAGMTFAVSGF